MKKLDIDAIKINGQIREIKGEIDRRIHKITNGTFESYKDSDKYCALGKCLESIKLDISEIEKLLEALNEIQPGNK